MKNVAEEVGGRRSALLMLRSKERIKLIDNLRGLLCGALYVCDELCTGKSVSEALIFESVNPQYDERLFIESPPK